MKKHGFKADRTESKQVKEIIENFVAREDEKDQERLAKLKETESSFTKYPPKVQSEQNFQFALEHFSLVGTWDRVSEEEEGVVITEYKTNLGRRTAEDSLQLMTYTLAYEKIHGKRPIKAVLQCIKTGASSVHIPDDQYLQQAHTIILQTVQQIQKGIFTANPNFISCRLCNWRKTCPVAVDIKE